MDQGSLKRSRDQKGSQSAKVEACAKAFAGVYWQSGVARECREVRHWGERVVALDAILRSLKSLTDLIVLSLLESFFEQQCEGGW